MEPFMFDLCWNFMFFWVTFFSLCLCSGYVLPSLPPGFVHANSEMETLPACQPSHLTCHHLFKLFRWMHLHRGEFFFFFFLANCSFNTGSSLSTLIRRVRWDEAVAGSASITCSLSHPAPLFSRHRPWKQHTFLFTIVWFNRSPGVIHVKQTSGSKHALRQNLEFNQTLLSETCHILAVSGRQFRKTQLGNYPQNQNRNKEESP